MPGSVASRAPEIGLKAGLADSPLVPSQPPTRRPPRALGFSPRSASVGYGGGARRGRTRAPPRVLLGPACRVLSAQAAGGLSPHELPSPIQWPLSAGPFVQEAATSCRTEQGAGGRKPRFGGQPGLGSCLGGSSPSEACWVGERAGMSPGEAVVGAGFVGSDPIELGEGPRKVPRLRCLFQVCASS